MGWGKKGLIIIIFLLIVILFFTPAAFAEEDPDSGLVRVTIPICETRMKETGRWITTGYKQVSVLYFCLKEKPVPGTGQFRIHKVRVAPYVWARGRP